jgi:hypothetical protein
MFLCSFDLLPEGCSRTKNSCEPASGRSSNLSRLRSFSPGNGAEQTRKVSRTIRDQAADSALSHRVAYPKFMRPLMLGSAEAHGRAEANARARLGFLELQPISPYRCRGEPA